MQRVKKVEERYPREYYDVILLEIHEIENMIPISVLEKVIKNHKEYSVLAEELSTLLDERHPKRKIERAKQALYDAYVESERSLDEIIDLIRNADEWI